MMMFAEPDKTSCVIRKDPVTLTPLIHVRKPMIVTFHEIVDSSSSDIYKLSLEQFEAYLQVIQELREEPEANNFTIQVTFDDGHISHYQLAIPLLEQYRIRAVFFVTVGLIGVSTQYMCWSQLKELVALGHEVQSHTWSHPFLTDCSPSLLQEELRRSRETLEQRLALPVRAISIPYGRYTGRVLQACASAGYERVYTSDPWIGSKVAREFVCTVGFPYEAHSNLSN